MTPPLVLLARVATDAERLQIARNIRAAATHVLDVIDTATLAALDAFGLSLPQIEHVLSRQPLPQSKPRGAFVRVDSGMTSHRQVWIGGSPRRHALDLASPQLLGREENDRTAAGLVTLALGIGALVGIEAFPVGRVPLVPAIFRSHVVSIAAFRQRVA